MRKETLLELLAAHADALNATEDVETFDSSGWLLAYYGREVSQQVMSLLQVAQAIKQVLVPVPPPALFRMRLRQRLVQEEAEVEKRPKRHLVWLGAALGSALSIGGFFLYRRWRLKSLPGASSPATEAI